MSDTHSTRPPRSSLSQQMESLVDYIETTYRAHPSLTHWDLFRRTAEHFECFDIFGDYPTWLSRVVEGVMLDVDNDER